MFCGPLFDVGTLYSVITPEGVILPILLPVFSVNHTLPSGPGAIPTGKADAVGIVYSVIAPVVGLILPTLLAPFSVNHMSPSGPAVIRAGTLFAVGVAYSVMTPEVLIFATLLVPCSVNHM